MRSVIAGERVQYLASNHVPKRRVPDQPVHSGLALRRKARICFVRTAYDLSRAENEDDYSRVRSRSDAVA
jgi:hypothetical protein